ncbi:MAG: 4-(cytidine 5'-diphospho)-2-C-methyl-D-erythritol kinase [Actinomycetota bacterium]|nr:4-(cytidine 5'-diphospho)-2-C-methyl-D-erythritol kinase [Actinomycetota bacterium]
MRDTQRALAKLTLSLRVTGVRGDGYHMLDAEMVTVDLADVLTFGAGDGLQVIGATGLDAGDSNLVRRALRAVGRAAAVRLEKHIPVGAGLGGGSADAAAVLRWAGCTDTALAAGLGADVPFCLIGGRARVTGIGDEIEALPFEERTFTLLPYSGRVSTVAVYETWDRLGGPTFDGSNDLEPAALKVEPGLAEWRDRLGDATGCTPMLAGSGGTWFVEGEFPDVPGAVVTHTESP